MLNKIKKNIFRNLENKLIKFISSIIILALVFVFSFLYDKYNDKVNLFNLYKSKVTNNNQIYNVNDDKKIDSNFINNKNFEFVGEFIVTRVIDGDTVDIRKINEDSLDRVRIIAVNTLEKNSLDKKEKCFANLATDFTERELLNKKVKLYYDITQPKRDKYDRLLAYVLRDGDHVFYNEILMRSGLSKVYKASPKALEYDKYENMMRENIQNKIGIWDDKLCYN